ATAKRPASRSRSSGSRHARSPRSPSRRRSGTSGANAFIRTIDVLTARRSNAKACGANESIRTTDRFRRAARTQGLRCERTIAPQPDTAERQQVAASAATNFAIARTYRRVPPRITYVSSGDKWGASFLRGTVMGTKHASVDAGDRVLAGAQLADTAGTQAGKPGAWWKGVVVEWHVQPIADARADSWIPGMAGNRAPAIEQLLSRLYSHHMRPAVARLK